MQRQRGWNTLLSNCRIWRKTMWIHWQHRGVGFKAENPNRLASDPADTGLKVSMECKAFKYCEFLYKLFCSYWSPRKQQKDVKLHMKRKVGCFSSWVQRKGLQMGTRCRKKPQKPEICTMKWHCEYPQMGPFMCLKDTNLQAETHMFLIKKN